MKKAREGAKKLEDTELKMREMTAENTELKAINKDMQKAKWALGAQWRGGGEVEWRK